MGLFGKKKAKELDESLDIPPPPPVGAAPAKAEPKEEAEAAPEVGTGGIPPLPKDITKAPEMAGAPEEAGPAPMPEMQPMEAPPQQPAPQPIQRAPPPQAHVLPPEEPSQPSFEIPPISEPAGGGPAMLPEEPEEEKPFEELFQPEEPARHPGMERGLGLPAGGKEIFVELSNYRRILKDIDNIKKALKQSDAEVDELISDIKAEEDTFSGIHGNLTDVEDRLVQLEKTLFSK
jgi:hypothetical protein